MPLRHSEIHASQRESGSRHDASRLSSGFLFGALARVLGLIVACPDGSWSRCATSTADCGRRDGIFCQASRDHFLPNLWNGRRLDIQFFPPLRHRRSNSLANLPIDIARIEWRLTGKQFVDASRLTSKCRRDVCCVRRSVAADSCKRGCRSGPLPRLVDSLNQRDCELCQSLPL